MKSYLIKSNLSSNFESNLLYQEKLLLLSSYFHAIMKAISQANQEGQMLQERKRGKKPIPSSIPGYVRFSEALSLFQPLSENVFNYRVRSSDIKHTKDEHGRLYEIESIDTVRKFLLN